MTSPCDGPFLTPKAFNTRRTYGIRILACGDSGSMGTQP
eukprot:CAMPEP_0119554862 /NCGR_PEP_ID=MMETSP1352-20130426/7230_1 /TAXON_ID=265584 /ORGANISM="Stauroneis constricta, Strain CCMP1120" /LENGTH=38 /DNA_ID= /DNA_START= /DNA_END= /DNA_ORIENTATION=